MTKFNVSKRWIKNWIIKSLVRHPRQRRWLDEWGSPQRRPKPLVIVYVNYYCLIRLETSFLVFALFLDVLSDDVFVKANGWDGVSSGPEGGAGVVLLLALERSGNGYGALSLQKPDDRGDGVLGRYFNAHVDVVGAEIAFRDSGFLLLGQFMEYFHQFFSYLAIQRFFPVFRREYQMIFAIPLGMG